MIRDLSGGISAFSPKICAAEPRMKAKGRCHMLFYGKTDVGRKRAVNQDNFVIRKYADDVLFAVVCDGMGGANGGNVASAIASDTFREQLDAAEREHPSFFGIPGIDILDVLSAAATDANRAVYRTALDDPELEGMGTTLVGCVLVGTNLYVVNVGDSRLYAVRDGEIEQISHDHSYVQYLVDTGKMTPEEARYSRNRNIITRAVGTEKIVGADLFSETAAPGSFVVLCSDGLTNHVEPFEIRDRLLNSEEMSAEELQRACEDLIALANERGGTDNITVVVLMI